MVGAAGIESGLALGARAAAGEVFRNAQRVVAMAAEDGFGATLGLAPNNGGMANRFVVALDAGVKSIAALEFDGNNVALRVVMDALGACIHADAVANDGR